MLWFVLSSAFANAPVDEVLGWTDDTFVYRARLMMQFPQDFERDELSEEYSFYGDEIWPVVCAQPRVGPERCWEDVERSHLAVPDVPLATPIEWKAWSQAHPLLPPGAPGGTIGVSMPSQASAPPLEVYYGSVDDPEPFLVFLEAGDERWEWRAGVVDLGSGAPHNVTVTASPSPDGHLIAVSTTNSGFMHMRGPAAPSSQIWIWSGARTTLSRSDKVTDEAVAAASRLLGEAGFVFLQEQPAKKARNRTVVYYAARWEGEARAAAEALGGVAELMDWESRSHLVIALGNR
ncbi:MAG: hypothetical protein KC912_20410 [Proteobacteria bacterium]|nr:hypothetical protein [Pseudomonadota bacterium]